MFKPTKVIDRKTPSTKMNEETNQNIQVFVRCRPLNSNEKKALIDVIPEKRSIRTIQHNKLYSFDNVFDDKAKQLDVYRSVVEPLVEQVIEGYNCTVFAYGQTGTGKTFTMVGDRTDNKISWEEDPLSGIIPRAIDQLLDELQHQNTEYTIRVSFLELYNEEAYDLLSALSDTGKLRIYNDSERKGSVIISGLVEMIVQTKAEIFEILEKGSLKRQTAPTLMNACSSRSHSIFSITVHIKEIAFDGEEVVKMGKLNLVDLAGSENIGRSGAVEERAREASNINKSLLTLGRVITSLVEKSSHIPYRDSKLTRLLQDSLGGKTKTSIIATISPCNDDLEDTISTLDYAQRAKKITNKPEINLKMSKKTLINEYLAEIDRLRRDLEANRDKKGIYVDAKNYALMEAMVKSQEQGLEEKEAQIENMKKELENYSTILSKTNEDLGIKCQELENTKEKLEELSKYLEKTKEILKETEKEVENCKVVIDAHKKTEVKLLKKAETVVNVADKCVDDNEKLYHKVDTFGSLENQNSVSLKMFQENSIKQLKNIRSLNDVISSDLAEGKGSIEKLIENVEPEIESKNIELKTNFEKMKNNIEKFAFVMMESLERNNDNNDTKSTVNICNLLDDFKTSLSEELAQFSESLKENGSENDHILDELCQESIKNRSHLEESIMAQSSRINEFSKHINLMVHSCDDLSKQIHNDKSKEFEQFSKDIIEIKKQVDSMDLNQRLEKMEKEHKEKLIEMEMMFTRSLSTVKQEYQEKMKSFSTVLDDFQNRVQTLMANDLEMRDQQSFKYQELIRSVCKYEKENFALLSELDTRNNLNCESSVQKYDQIRKIRRKLADHFQRFQSNNETNMQEYFGKIDEKIHAIIDEIIVSTCKSTKDIESNQSIADEISDKIHDTLEQILSELKQIESKCQALNFSQEFQLNEFTKMVKNLEINYKKYQTTGCTPKRSKFWYPKTFTPTSPHDRIIARYRQKYLTNNVVDDDIDEDHVCDDFKEELNFESDSPSPSSESDESPSSSNNNSISSCGENLENNNKMASNNQLMKPPSGTVLELNNAKKLLNDTVTVVSSAATNDRTICMRRLLKEKN